MQGARLYDDIHVSGHLREEGHYEMLDALQPQHLIPAHQTLKGRSPYVDLATSQGTSSDVTCTSRRTGALSNSPNDERDEGGAGAGGHPRAA